MPKEKYESSKERRQHRILTPEEVAAGKKTKWEALEITGTIRNVSPRLWNLNHLTALYLNDNCLQRVPAEICHLTNLLYLDLSANKLRSLPAELGDMVSLRELLLNHNYLRALPLELGRLFQLIMLGLKGNPLPNEVLSIYEDGNGTQRLLTQLLDSLHAGSPNVMPPVRPWLHLAHPERSKPAAIYSLMCYNVLCDKYATRQLYGYCPSWALDWEYRRKGIMDEIINNSADIICLQEVETDQYFNFFLLQLKQHGYDGVFSPKSRAKTMGEHERKHVDGCAIFFRTSKFSLVKEHLVEFNQVAMANAEGCEDMLNRVMTKDNIGIIALLEIREGCFDPSFSSESTPRQLLMVANAHIHWDPEFCDVKLIQIMMLMKELKKFQEEESHSFRPGSSSSANDQPAIPLLLAGDFNSLPESGVIEYLAKGKISLNHPDFKDMDYKKLFNFSSSPEQNGHISHSFRLRRSYENTHMEFTNHTFDFKGVIDYVFYSHDYMSPLGVLGPMNCEWFESQKVMGCPNPNVMSDHFSLLVEFEMPLNLNSGVTGSGNNHIVLSRR
ncbi:CCR4-NOT transcription complex subunit 6-like [Anneissia japonica]|uniref:CCR4-NOT transcription complex subunit 6-like n=1 Tax=Anneissia japonica TaxID=1529436 RepID=UPI00142586B0|nr:CCR4-NOT transcription complex subunit 6-like [Anneissia japonica]